MMNNGGLLYQLSSYIFKAGAKEFSSQIFQYLINKLKYADTMISIPIMFDRLKTSIEIC